MGLDAVLAHAEKQEFAIVNEIELTTADLFCLITELDSQELKEIPKTWKEYRNRFKVESEDDSANIFDFFALKHEFVERWFKREYTVTYEGVPLRLVEHNRKNL